MWCLAASSKYGRASQVAFVLKNLTHALAHCLTNHHYFLQVNIPKIKKGFCKGCNKHTPHKVTQYKAGKASLYAQGA